MMPEIAATPHDAPVRDTSVLVLEAGRTEGQYWRDLWRYRELFYFLAWRDILVRYKQTAIGIAWAVIRPFLTVLVFTVVFSRIAKLSAPGEVPYGLLVMAGMLPWQFFSTALGEASNSLVNNSNLISKVYFPRLLVPAGTIITSLVDFVITLALTALVMAWFHFVPDWRLLMLPLFVLLAIGVSTGLGLWFAALNVEYRDFRYVIPFVIQFGLYISPVGFSSGIVPDRWRFAYSLNPMVGVIDGFRWCLLRGESQLWWPSILTSLALTILLCGSSVWYFRSVEKTFADVI